MGWMGEKMATEVAIFIGGLTLVVMQTILSVRDFAA
jgi:hypothetical protein